MIRRWKQFFTTQLEMVRLLLNAGAEVNPLKGKHSQPQMPLEKAFELANQVMRDNLTSDGDAREGIGAFLEKRDPEWG